MTDKDVSLEEDFLEENDYYAAYFNESENGGYYMERWESAKVGDTLLFNGYAFFFGTFWFIYKKMYVEALVIMIIGGLIEVMVEVSTDGSSQGNTITTVINIGTKVLMGFAGNYFYMRKAERVVLKVKDQYWDNDRVGETDMLNIIHKKGKPDWLIFGLITAALVALTIIGIAA